MTMMSELNIKKFRRHLKETHAIDPEQSGDELRQKMAESLLNFIVADGRPAYLITTTNFKQFLDDYATLV